MAEQNDAPIVDVVLCPLCGQAQWNPTREGVQRFEVAHRICHVFDPIIGGHDDA